MIRIALLSAVSILAIATCAHAEDAVTPATPDNNSQTAFSQAIHSIKSWFGSDTPVESTPITDTTTASDDTLQVPPPVGAPSAIEPAAGIDEDTLQVPPPYYGPQSNAGADRATAFDNNPSTAAFGTPSDAASANAIVPAAGDEAAPDMSKIDCDAILKASKDAQEGDDIPDTALIEACASKEADPSAQTPASAQEPVKQPAQPGFDNEDPAAPEVPLPQTQPAAGAPVPNTGPIPLPGDKAK